MRKGVKNENKSLFPAQNVNLSEIVADGSLAAQPLSPANPRRSTRNIY
jgi:hypothetical protein